MFVELVCYCLGIVNGIVSQKGNAQHYIIYFITHISTTKLLYLWKSLGTLGEKDECIVCKECIYDNTAE